MRLTDYAGRKGLDDGNRKSMDVVGSDSSGNNDIDDFSDGRKMTRAEFIMA